MTTLPKVNDTLPNVTIIGWREWIALPELGLPKLRAKIDTGARTAAIHATDIALSNVGGVEHVSFCLPFDNDRRVQLPVYGQRRVRNTSGIPETRTIVSTNMVLGGMRWPIHVALSNRENMLNPIILGRTSVRGRRLVVNPGRSFLQGLPSLQGDDE